MDPSEKIGLRFESNNYGWYEVVGVNRDKSYLRYVIRFDIRGFEAMKTWTQVKTGEARNPFYPIYSGVGYLAGGTAKHKFFKRWRGMLERCYDPEDKDYERYGGRGIKVAPILHNFANYVALLEALPGYNEDGLDSIDREDNDKGYTPGNLRWANDKMQSMNRRCQRVFIARSPDGVEYQSSNQLAFAETHGLQQGNFNRCLNTPNSTHKGWTFEYVTDDSSLESFEIEEEYEQDP